MILKKSHPELEKKEIKINKTIPTLKSQNVEIKIPIIKKTNPIIEYRLEFGKNCNKRVPKIEKKEKRIIPIFKRKKLIVEESERLINRKIPNILIKEEFVSEKEIKETISEETVEGRKEGGVLPPEERKKKPIKIFGLNPRTFSGRPIVIFLKDENDGFIGSLEEICWLLYREIKGGRAKPKKINAKEDLTKNLAQLEAEGKIFTIDFQKMSNLGENKNNSNIMKNKLAQLYGQDLGFIIFKNLYFISYEYNPNDHKIKFLNLKPNDKLVEDFKSKKAVCSFLWGLVNLQDKDFKEPDHLRFDNIFSIAKEKYEEYFKNILEPYLTITKQNKYGKESDDNHYIIKLFVVKFLCNELGFYRTDDLPDILNYIITEENFIKNGTEENLIPDVYVSKDSDMYADEVYEIETLFGQGNYAIKKIDATIDKYDGMSIAKLNIVLNNFTFLMHFSEIRKKRKIHKMLREANIRKFDLEFWTLNLADNRLINFKDFNIKLKRFIKEGLFPIFLDMKGP